MTGRFRHFVVRAAILLALVLAPESRSWARGSPDPNIDRYVRDEMVERRIPGLALLVARDHKIVLAADYGVASVELDAPVTERTAFEIASMTKQFTDAAVLLLVDQGKLALDDRLSRYFPELPPAWQPITLRQLMNHTAGLRDDWDEDDSFFYSKTTPAEFFTALKAAPLKFPPGTDWSYGCGPFVLGLLIERVTGKPYARFMRETIFQPLGLRSTDVNDQGPIVAGRAAGYVIRDGVVRNGVRLSPAAEARADVGVRTTARDLAAWDAALDGGGLLSESSRKLMFTPARLAHGEPTPCGLGWFVTPFRGHIEVEHAGGFRTGFSTVIARYPDDRLTVIVLTNLQGAHAYSIARGIASFYNPDYRPIPMMETQADRDPSRTAIVTRILTAVGNGRTSEDLLPHASRWSQWTLAELRDVLADASAPVFIASQDLSGRGVSLLGTPIVANAFYRTDGRHPAFWTFSFTADGRVAYFELEQ